MLFGFFLNVNSEIENTNKVSYSYASVLQKGSLNLTATSLLPCCFYGYYHI